MSAMDKLQPHWCDAEASAKTQPLGLFEPREPHNETVTCTLPYGHDGYHVAEDIYDRIVGCWPGEWVDDAPEVP